MLDEAAGQFLYLCLRGRWEPTALQAARALSENDDFDWYALWRIVEQEGVAPLLFQIVRG